MSSPSSPDDAKPRINPATYWLIGILMLGGFPVLMQYRAQHNQAAREQYDSLHGLGPTVRPPLVTKLERDLEATNCDGKTVRLAELRDKVWVGAYFATDCPADCVKMAGVLDRLRKDIGDPERFRVVSISVNSPADTPEKIAAFFKQNGIEAPDWWYLTAPDEKMIKYFSKYFQLPPPRIITDPAQIKIKGAVDHDTRVVLVDAIANVRGYYRPTDASPRKIQGTKEETTLGELDYGRMKRDIEYLLKNETPAAPTPVPVPIPIPAPSNS